MKERTIEQALARLEEIITKLGDSSVTLDSSLTLYTEGVQLSQGCLEQIEKAEQVVEQYAAKERLD